VRWIPHGGYSQFSRPEPLLFFEVAPHLSSQGLGEPGSRPTATQKTWQCRKSNPGPLGLQPRSLTTRAQRRSLLSQCYQPNQRFPWSWSLYQEEESWAPTQHLASTLWNLKVHYRIQKSLPLSLSWSILIHSIPHYLSKASLIFHPSTSWLGVRGRVVVKALCYKPEGRGFETRWGEWFLSSYLILPVALGTGVYSASNRMSTRGIKIMFLGSKAAAGA
jgi:hypothetical protein